MGRLVPEHATDWIAPLAITQQTNRSVAPKAVQKGWRHLRLAAMAWVLVRSCKPRAARRSPAVRRVALGTAPLTPTAPRAITARLAFVCKSLRRELPAAATRCAPAIIVSTAS